MKTIYRCDGCGQEFEDWKNCLGHEDAHVQIKSTKLFFWAYKIHPRTVRITFKDDCFGIYELSGEIQEPQKDSPPATDNSEEGQQ